MHLSCTRAPADKRDRKKKKRFENGPESVTIGARPLHVGMVGAEKAASFEIENVLSNDVASVRSIKSVHFALGVFKVGADYLLMCPRGHPLEVDSLRHVGNV